MKIRYKTLTLILLLVITNNVYSQVESDNYYTSFEPKLQYEYFNAHNLSLGFSLLHNDIDEISGAPVFLNGAFVDFGCSTLNQQNLFSSKIGYEAILMFVATRLNLIYHTDFNQNQFALRPEIGLSICSYISVTYGYNIYLNQNPFKLGKNVLSVNIAFLFDKRYESWPWKK